MTKTHTANEVCDAPACDVLGTRVHATTYEEATARILDLASAGASAGVVAANVHVVMEARASVDFRKAVAAAGIVTPDGMPLVFAMRRLGFPRQERVYGPTLMMRVADGAAAAGIPVGLLGATNDVLRRLAERLRVRFPDLQVAYSHAPPFRPLSASEDDRLVADIIGSGARIVFVGLGCPKQELWMAAHKGRVPAVMLGVGAAFAIHSGARRQAPPWIQAAGLEWLFRLAQEPGRLGPRYLRHNPRFALLLAAELLRRGRKNV